MGLYHSTYTDMLDNIHVVLVPTLRLGMPNRAWKGL